MPTPLYYDIETSGKGIKNNGPKAFIAPLQFGAITYDPNGNQIERVNWRGRPPRQIVPEPGALVVTGQSIGSVMSAQYSQYELVSKIHRFFEEKAPASIVAFNGIKYDEEVLRFAQYQNLYNPYQSQLHGNTRLDVMKASHAAVAFDQSSLQLQRNKKGKLSFKLEHIAAANGYNGHDAHDALGDVEATRFVFDTLALNSPQIARACNSWQSKSRMLEILEERDPIVQFGWNYMRDEPVQRTVLPVCPDTINMSEWVCVDVDQDLTKLRQATPEALKSKMKSYKGIRSVKINAMPTVVPAGSAMGRKFATQVDPAEIAALLADLNFRSNLQTAKKMRREEYAEPKTVWEQLYSGGFYPDDADKRLFQDYHDANPHKKWEIAQNFTDPRARELARWQIGSEWGFVFSDGERAAYENELREYLFEDEADWMTVPRALREIEEGLFTADSDGIKILEEYQAYLQRMGATSVK